MHTLVIDGVFSELRSGQLTFHQAPLPSDADVAQVLATVRARVGRLLARRQLEPADDTTPADPLAEVSPVLAGLVGASVQGRVALGPRAGARVRHLGDEPDLGHVASRGPRQAQLDGFDLHANVWVPPNDRARLEQLCRYLLRPPLAVGSAPGRPVSEYDRLCYGDGGPRTGDRGRLACVEHSGMWADTGGPPLSLR